MRAEQKNKKCRMVVLDLYEYGCVQTALLQFNSGENQGHPENVKFSVCVSQLYVKLLFLPFIRSNYLIKKFEEKCDPEIIRG